MREKKRGHYVAIKLRDEEYETLKNEAKSFNLPISSYMRMRLLSPKGEALKAAAPLGQPFTTPPVPLTDADREAIIEALREDLKKKRSKGTK